MIIEMDNEPIGEMNYRDLGQATAQIGIKICAAPRRKPRHRHNAFAHADQ